MNPYRRLKALTHYPEWHEKPLRLSTAEINNPWLVLEEFFNMYHLSGFRDSLKLWLDDSFNSGSDDLSSHVHTCNMAEKLAEAAYLLYEKREKEEEEDDVAEEYQIPDNDPDSREEIGESGFEEEEGEDRRQFIKRPLLGSGISKHPVKLISKIFTTEDLDSLKETIKEWCRMALANERANYEKASQREDLLIFCNELARLAEAVYCIYTIHKIEERSGFSLNDPAGLQPDILRQDQPLSLSYEELLNPLKVLHDFWEQFPPGYVKAELWDLLDSAISTDSHEKDKLFLLLHYQCLLTLIEASWHLHVQKAGQKNKEDLEETNNEFS